MEERLRERLMAGQQAADGAIAQRPSFTLLERRGLLLAEGDSWFDYVGDDILTVLQDDHGWEVRTVAKYGEDLEDMAYNPNQFNALLRLIQWAKVHGQVPTAILLSAGGNDLAGPELKSLLNHARSGHPGINDVILDELVFARLQEAYVYLLAGLSRASHHHFGKDIPVLLHGYDYPVVDGRGFLGGWSILPGPWLKPTFTAKGLDVLAENNRSMAVIIDRFNEMLIRLVAIPEFAGHVHFVELRGTLSVDPNTYQEWWANEMHPTPTGFRKVADRFTSALANL